MTWLASWRARRGEDRVRQIISRYETIWDDDAISDRQLQTLNASWAEMRGSSLGAATALQRRWSLPDAFESWEQFEGLVPVCTKADLRNIVEDAGEAAFEGVEWRATAGTTGEPFRFPVFAHEAEGHVLEMWAARKRLGVGQDARVSLLWGHAHMLGSGVGGVIRKANRQLADHMLGYQRISAYDLTDVALMAAGHAMIKHRPEVLIGYSNALDRFAEANAALKPQFDALPLRAVIATGEGFATPAAAQRVRSFFTAPVRMEYGSVETGVLAYQFADEGYDALWQRHRLEGIAELQETDHHDGGIRQLTVTSLYPRALPVWRYQIGDRVELYAGDDTPLIGFARVLGRSNLLIHLPGGEQIHSEAISHVVREEPSIRLFQMVVSGSKNATILRYLAPRPLSSGEADRLCERLSRVNPVLSGVTLEHDEMLAHSPAGKHAIVVYED